MKVHTFAIVVNARVTQTAMAALGLLRTTDLRRPFTMLDPLVAEYERLAYQKLCHNLKNALLLLLKHIDEPQLVTKIAKSALKADI